MKDSTPSAESSRVSPRSQRRSTATNAATTGPHPSKRTSRVTTTGLQTPGVGKENKTKSSKEDKITGGLPLNETPLPLPEGSTPKKSRSRKEVKQEIQDIQEQDSLEGDAPIDRHIKPKEGKSQQPTAPQIDSDTPKATKRKRAVKVEEEEIDVGEPSPKKARRKKATEAEADEKIVESEISPRKVKRKTKVKEEEEEGEADEEVQKGDSGQKKIQRKRKTKEEKELEAMPLAARTDGLRMLIGAHVSGAKGRFLFSMYIASVELKVFPLSTILGVHNSVTNCVHIG